MLVVVDKGVEMNLDIVLAAIAALEVRRMVCLSVHIEFHHFAMCLRNEFLCSNWLMLVVFPYLLLLTVL